MDAALSQLEATPDIVHALIAGLSAEDVIWKPAPDRWSIAEVLEHLSHTEGHDFRPRVEAAVNEDRPQWEVYDEKALAAAGQYSGRDPEDSFDHFEERREDNLEFLRGLPPGAGERAGIHPRLGPITVSELVNEWAFHDLGHIRQIAEITRARKYYPHIGAFQQIVKVNP